MGDWQDRADKWQAVTGQKSSRDALYDLMNRYSGFGEVAWLKLSFREIATLETVLIGWHLYQMRKAGYEVGDQVLWKEGICGAPAPGTIGTVAEPWWQMADGIPVTTGQGGAWVWHANTFIKLSVPTEV